MACRWRGNRTIAVVKLWDDMVLGSTLGFMVLVLMRCGGERCFVVTTTADFAEQCGLSREYQNCGTCSIQSGQVSALSVTVNSLFCILHSTQLAGKAVEKAKFTKESDDVLMLLCKHRSTFLYSIVSVDVPASLKRSSLVTLREVKFPSDMTRRVDGFLVSNGMLWVVLYELFADGYKLRCVDSGEYCTFSGGGKIRTMGCEHFCVFNKTSSSGTVYIASKPPKAVFSFENPCYDPHMQLQSWNMGILATGESRPPGSPIASVVIQNAFHGLTQASLKFPSRFTLTEGWLPPQD
ncbi:hypothetical protein Pelo_18807 [Pelomyxa schiedti]|nr:hypothetical protein Pelo_18807 [Pelomyxa schiedti]